jgi:pimeloyl-ACP methyl ester carboxylesterase
VSLTASDPVTYHISGRLCYRTDNPRGKTVQLLVPGHTYDHNYYNPGYLPNSYSWVYAETSKGYSTFSIDRLGTGLSDKPPAAELTVPNEAYTVQQVVHWLRNGITGVPAFTAVVGVGHSLGAGILQYEAGIFTGAGDVPDVLILSDFLYDTYSAGIAQVQSSLYPASSDPAFASAGLPSGYYTTIPNTRAADFYSTANAEASMISLDESTKQTGTISEITSMPAARNNTVTMAIGVPTMIAVGQFDNLDCNTAAGLPCDTAVQVINRERSHYSITNCLYTYVESGAGHDMNLHIKGRDFFNAMATWLDGLGLNTATLPAACA